ncbi:hypothetical protein C8R46DRAFT_1030690 [Mycena filopes]|nr:hypothetical protein C8R46DRAFT_1030690 [Mycena filopes]
MTARSGAAPAPAAARASRLQMAGRPRDRAVHGSATLRRRPRRRKECWARSQTRPQKVWTKKRYLGEQIRHRARQLRQPPGDQPHHYKLACTSTSTVWRSVWGRQQSRRGRGSPTRMRQRTRVAKPLSPAARCQCDCDAKVPFAPLWDVIVPLNGAAGSVYGCAVTPDTTPPDRGGTTSKGSFFPSLTSLELNDAGPRVCYPRRRRAPNKRSGRRTWSVNESSAMWRSSSECAGAGMSDMLAADGFRWLGNIDLVTTVHVLWKKDEISSSGAVVGEGRTRQGYPALPETKTPAEDSGKDGGREGAIERAKPYAERFVGKRLTERKSGGERNDFRECGDPIQTVRQTPAKTTTAFKAWQSG